MTTPQDLLNRIALHSAGKWTQRGYVLFGWLFGIRQTPSGPMLSVIQDDAVPGSRKPNLMIALDSPADWSWQLYRFADRHSIPFIRQVL